MRDAGRAFLENARTSRNGHERDVMRRIAYGFFELAHERATEKPRRGRDYDW